MRNRFGFLIALALLIGFSSALAQERPQRQDRMERLNRANRPDGAESPAKPAAQTDPQQIVKVRF